VPKAFCDTTIALPFNDAEAMERAFRAHGDRIARGDCGTGGGEYGLRASLPGYLEALRVYTARFGALLIFDEVMTGFRVAFGGAQQR